MMIVGSAGCFAGCFGSSTTEFPPGLEPLEDDNVPLQSPGAYTETLEIVEQPFTMYNSVHARGYVFAPPAVVWARSKDPDVMEQGCAATRHSSTTGDEPEYEYSFDIHYEVDMVITVAWDEQWRFGTVGGTPDAPTRTMVRYQKVSGSDFIKILEGSVQYYAVADDPNVTMVEYVEHVNARGSNAQDSKNSMTHRFAATLAVAHDQPNPGCD
jgi:hypothetical protein